MAEEPGSGAGSAESDTGGPAEGGLDLDELEPDHTLNPQLTGAPDDEEMPLADHVEEMIRRLGVVIVAMALVSGVVFPFADQLINFLWYSFLPGSVSDCPTAQNPDIACPYLYHPLALMFARLKVAALAGFVVALPVMVYESYLFMRPGLYPGERRYYLASVPTSLLLALLGVAFAYLLVLPTLFIYFTGYTTQAADIAFGLSETFNLIVMMLGFFALVFQIPLLIMLAIMMGVTSRQWLAGRRLYFWGAFATIAFIFSPDPTGMAPIMVAVTMIVLFEGTLLLLKWTGESSPVPTGDELAARRPFAWLLAGLAGFLLSPAPAPEGYWDRLPTAVTEALVGFGVSQFTPLLIGGALIAVYELAVYLYPRLGSRPDVYRVLVRLRFFVWPVSLFVGYLGSPDPVVLERVTAVDLTAVEAATAAAALIALFELAVFVLRWREGLRGADEADSE